MAVIFWQYTVSEMMRLQHTHEVEYLQKSKLIDVCRSCGCSLLVQQNGPMLEVN